MRTQSNIQDVAPCEQSYRLQVVGCYSDYAPVLSNVQCNLKVKVTLNPIQDVHFWAAHGWGGGGKKAPLPKISDTYTAMMKFGTVTPYHRRSKKSMNHVTHTLTSADISIFFTGN